MEEEEEDAENWLCLASHTPSRFLPGKSQERLEDLRRWASLAEAPKVDGNSVSPPFFCSLPVPLAPWGRKKGGN